MKTDLPMREIRRRLLWVEFLSPLSEEEMVVLLRDASFDRLEEGKVLVVGPEEHAEWMLVVVAGQLQVYEVSLRSGREMTLWVSGDGEAVCVTGLVPRWTRELHLRALEPTLLCRVGREALGGGAVQP
jgi:CRP-like cAMP-binding protein